VAPGLLSGRVAMLASILVLLPLLVLAHDVRLCVSFYRETNRARPAGAPGGRRQLAPDQVTLRHALLFLVQKANYYWQLVTSLVLLVPLYLRPKKTTDEDVARLLLATSLVTWATATRSEDGSVRLVLDLGGFAFPHLPGRFDNRLVVETELRHAEGGDPDAGLVARTLRFELDGEPIASRSEQLSILAIMISSVVHPIVHSFNNALYKSHDDPAAAAYEDLFLHGQYLNWCAWRWPGTMFRGIPCERGELWYKQVLAHNAELSIPTHNHRSFGLLAPFSRSVRFLLAARPVFAKRRKEFGVAVDGEALYLCTVLHAIDHVFCDVYTRGHRFEHTVLPSARGHNLIALMFYRPAQHFLTNLLRDKQDKTPFYRALYQDLRAVDAGLADHVTLSISY
jgi:hypothetical protein